MLYIVAECERRVKFQRKITYRDLNFGYALSVEAIARDSFRLYHILYNLYYYHQSPQEYAYETLAAAWFNKIKLQKLKLKILYQIDFVPFILKLIFIA